MMLSRAQRAALEHLAAQPNGRAEAGRPGLKRATIYSLANRGLVSIYVRLDGSLTAQLTDAGALRQDEERIWRKAS